MLIPSIDLYNGQAVQWRQGKEPVLARDDVFALLEKFSLYGEVALIDLNAALGEGDNKALIKALLAKQRCRVGGGIRDLNGARDYLKAGASKIILGTKAGADWVTQLPRERLIFAIDAKADELVVNGWRDATGAKVLEVLPLLAGRCSELLYTQVLKEGMLQGLDRERIDAVIAASPVPVTIAGGISSIDDLRWLRVRGANAQVGMAIYTGVFDLSDAFISALDFDKQTLIPTIVQDVRSSEVLMLAYSSRASLNLALSERAGIYWSRSRQALWRKGEQSGHRQALVQVDVDCDGDSLIFRVEQTGSACHLQRRSCFARQNRPFSLASLDKTLAQRQALSSKQIAENDTDSNELNRSYSVQLFSDESLRNEKLREETEELIAASETEHVRWEAADLLYFTLVNARAKGVSLANIENELSARQR